MKNLLTTLTLAAGLGLALLPASASPFSNGGLEKPSTTLEQVQYGGGRCERLRRACQFKEERGESGEGNCRRYRDECGRDAYCARLKNACYNKDERGERGEGNCRRYRDECRR